MIILGIDPGLQKTGWGIIFSEGHALQFKACGLIKTNNADALADRLAALHHGLSAVIDQWKPDTAAVEETFVNNNPASALKLGQARGVCLSVPAIMGIETAEYSANKIKKSLVGTGHAAKEQVGMMIRTLLPGALKNNGGQIGADEADALAVAICHAHYGRTLKAYATPTR
ncbi:MAG: crossover junction endodeoxyribonuclease RuvC [Alphaproteobacteria bacterium]|nr:crossover junction endodeoxyribonuclease RuvC [Alphaproteobacteria bacterium]